jgi:hypothetical protein
MPDIICCLVSVILFVLGIILLTDKKPMDAYRVLIPAVLIATWFLIACFTREPHVLKVTPIKHMVMEGEIEVPHYFFYSKYSDTMRNIFYNTGKTTDGFNVLPDNTKDIYVVTYKSNFNLGVFFLVGQITDVYVKLPKKYEPYVEVSKSVEQ